MDEEPLSFGERAADQISKVVGSWTFILIQSSILAGWMVLNSVAWYYHWDPHPFILLNLILSFQAAYTGPVLLMSQNRTEAKDRAMLKEIHRITKQLEQVVEVVEETGNLRSIPSPPPPPPTQVPWP